MRLIKTLALNTLIILVILYLISWLGSLMLSSYTRHGESLTLPNLKGLGFEEVQQILEQKKLRYIITDTAFIDSMPKGSVIEQNPLPNTKVKEGRFIYITLNSNSSVGVLMPNLINNSLRFAETVLNSSGLKLGTVIYKPDIAAGAVLDQLYKNQSIQPNIKIPKGASIDLIVGDGMGSTEVDIPDLTNLTLNEARGVLESNLLQVGSVVYEGKVDSLNAVIKRQSPSYQEGVKIKSGQEVDLFLAN
ncbi:MAG: PASTA domain-containing protein [Bacteroidota bacterium]|jgi:beta-lactam-binding protein with PASTA domain